MFCEGREAILAATMFDRILATLHRAGKASPLPSLEECCEKRAIDSETSPAERDAGSKRSRPSDRRHQLPVFSLQPDTSPLEPQ